MPPAEFNRRELLRGIGIAGLAGALRLPSGIPAIFGVPLPRPTREFVPDVELSLVAEPGEVQILPGTATRVWRFTGSVLAGPPESLQVIPGSYLGPVIRLRRGQNVRIRFSNRLPEPSIVHWHGLDVPTAADGHPHRAIPAGAEYIYEFEVINRAGTYWYHPHPHQRTGWQVYRGLAGLLLVSDPAESALDLPTGSGELPVVLQDRQFDSQNQLVYVGNGMMPRMMGFLGDRVLVNGQVQPTLSLATRAYRMRILNGSSARIYKLEWDDGTPITSIGGDGGLHEQPITQRFLTLAPAQRADVMLDLGDRPLGTTLRLRSAGYPAAEVSMTEMGMGMGGMGAPPLPNGAPLQLLTIRVERRETSTFRLPARLAALGPAWDRPAPGPVRQVALTLQRMQWLLGGRTFEMMATAPEEEVAAGSTVIWELVNQSGMMGMQMAHPIHIHGPQFRVLSRTPSGAQVASGSVREGLIDAGWHDTVLVLPGETVRVQLHVTKYPGLYLYHCHILEHEDMGMMRNFRVT
jgi:FtsP/CotA-like multicopper oxidase with cupredoxin domain